MLALEHVDLGRLVYEKLKALILIDKLTPVQETKGQLAAVLKGTWND